MVIDLIRHGEIQKKDTYCGITDTELTDKGWQDMQTACEKAHGWEQIITSPLQRCSKFATYLSEKLQLPLHIDPRWQEMNFGDWDGLTALQIMSFDEERLRNFWQDPSKISSRGGESLQMVISRVLAAWQAIIIAQKPVLVIAHGGPIRIVHCHVSGHPMARLMEIAAPYAEMHSFPLSDDVSV